MRCTTHKLQVSKAHPWWPLDWSAARASRKEALGLCLQMSADLRRLGICWTGNQGLYGCVQNIKALDIPANMSLPVIIFSLFFLVLYLMVQKILRHTSGSKEINTDSSLQPLPASMLQTPQNSSTSPGLDLRWCETCGGYRS